MDYKQYIELKAKYGAKNPFVMTDEEYQSHKDFITAIGGHVYPKEELEEIGWKNRPIIEQILDEEDAKIIEELSKKE